MKIYYYKQRQNTFELFNKKNSHIKRFGIPAATVLVILFYIIFNSHPTMKPQKQVTNTVTSPAVMTSLNNVPVILAEEFKATTLNIQSNAVQHDTEKDLSEQNPRSVAALSKPKVLPIKPESSTQTIVIRKRDTLEKILGRLNVSKKDLTPLLSLGPSVQALKKLKPGQKLVISTKDHHLTQLTYAFDPVSTLLINRGKDNNHYISQLKTTPLETKQSFTRFTVLGSIHGSAKKAGLSTKRTSQLASIFKSTVDFTRGNHSGDKVHVLFQDYFLNGKKIKEGEIVAAEYKTATNTYQAVRFTDPQGNSGYYAPDGSSMQKRFLPAPVKFTRISSLFNPKRWHPVLHRFRHHQGVDYAAPYGTPIKSVANGTIAQLGRQGGYGNTILIKHDSSYSTLYGHLSKYASGLKVGAHVQQGELIGYVGSSGLATGPHLHFEFRINGVHRNPLTVALPNGKSITHACRNKFHNEVKKLMAKLDAHRNSSKG